ncbi:hypothetical protein T12_11036 [Trichinella patagoniensis]|uniref:Integrase zinc-binding domain-containing protein n=1 Tax=Trichinella patagoniensis TaxID=990121 RepID=A0A0V0Z479_9BILA|nr:hypothetical protein T12_11036 [Trichinella patagoniensis]
MPTETEVEVQGRLVFRNDRSHTVRNITSIVEPRRIQSSRQEFEEETGHVAQVTVSGQYLSSWSAQEVRLEQRGDHDLRELIRWIEKGNLAGKATNIGQSDPAHALWIPDPLQRVHDSPEAGHLGLEKTLERLRRRFYWPSQREYVEDWCASCDDCAQKKICMSSKPKARSSPSWWAVRCKESELTSWGHSWKPDDEAAIY